ncbi:hypothetical protein BJ742DRAFT_780766 [Cladochytrium replicatum]|nr:hypothetical protein BJ742DRAFT_780766 [Cladochytrium replicatum]
MNPNPATQLRERQQPNRLFVELIFSSASSWEVVILAPVVQNPFSAAVGGRERQSWNEKALETRNLSEEEELDDAKQARRHYGERASGFGRSSGRTEERNAGEEEDEIASSFMPAVVSAVNSLRNDGVEFPDLSYSNNALVEFEKICLTNFSNHVCVNVPRLVVMCVKWRLWRSFPIFNRMRMVRMRMATRKNEDDFKNGSYCSEREDPTDGVPMDEIDFGVDDNLDDGDYETVDLFVEVLGQQLTSCSLTSHTTHTTLAGYPKKLGHSMFP